VNTAKGDPQPESGVALHYTGKRRFGRQQVLIPTGLRLPAVVKWLLMSEQEEQEPSFPLPPASFDFLVLSIRAQAEMQLGLMHFGEDEKPQPNLPLARHSIDLLSVLFDKTKGNLTIEEQRLLENSLTELRFRFVQVSGEVAKGEPQKA
jgi:hypothetical protein